jgi:hypothetical protein
MSKYFLNTIQYPTLKLNGPSTICHMAWSNSFIHDPKPYLFMNDVTMWHIMNSYYGNLKPTPTLTLTLIDP